MRIAIVGGGISGLVTAHLLARRHEITVFEASARPGGHTNTVRVDTADATHWVDTAWPQHAPAPVARHRDATRILHPDRPVRAG